MRGSAESTVGSRESIVPMKPAAAGCTPGSGLVTSPSATAHSIVRAKVSATGV